MSSVRSNDGLHPERRGWGAFGAFSLSGDLPREQRLALIEAQIGAIEVQPDLPPGERAAELSRLRGEWLAAAKDVYAGLQPWETVFVARHPRRPLVTDYIRHCVLDFCELHGDRAFGDDPAMVCGLGTIAHHRVLIVGHNRGRSIEERVNCNFGCAHPEGYRKALRKMRLAEKFGLPIVSLIDTPGAYPGTGAEERGVAMAIAENLRAMAGLRVPIVSVVIGEGGSGGALGIGVCDRMGMFEHSIYSVISPEGCAAILWKTSANAQSAAAALKLRAADLMELGLIDEIIPEPMGGAHRQPAQAAASFERFAVRAIDELSKFSMDQLIERRYERLRTLGSCYQERERRRHSA